ncbi:hypothetical protein Hamer_G000776 [Homarus americanus]|uniref:Uncharacterized protein n=1 Tax=Homarus americanus TaxID=6706 RepID=A0A8J5T1X1_HOMAM|nr:hypothetical protein Hamer_G000776 [Homarus americanus]
MRTEAEYLTMQGGITAGTVLALLLPVLIAMLCYASYVRNKHKHNYQDSDFIRSGSRRINNFFNKARRDSSPEPRPAIHLGGRGDLMVGGGSGGGSATPDTHHSDDTQV